MIDFSWHRFAELSTEQLYSFLALRSAVFVVEQNCAYQDLDGKDFGAHHLLGIENDSIVAYLRLFPPIESKNDIVFGRVVTAPDVRAKGYGKKMMQELLNYCENNFPGISITCSAQYYLKKFYESYGFKAYGDIYDEDGIPHIAMTK